MCVCSFSVPGADVIRGSCGCVCVGILYSCGATPKSVFALFVLATFFVKHLFFWLGLILEGVKKKTIWAPYTCRGHVTKAVPATKEGQARRGKNPVYLKFKGPENSLSLCIKQVTSVLAGQQDRKSSSSILPTFNVQRFQSVLTLSRRSHRKIVRSPPQIWQNILGYLLNTLMQNNYYYI